MQKRGGALDGTMEGKTQGGMFGRGVLTLEGTMSKVVKGHANFNSNAAQKY